VGSSALLNWREGRTSPAGELRAFGSTADSPFSFRRFIMEMAVAKMGCYRRPRQHFVNSAVTAKQIHSLGGLLAAARPMALEHDVVPGG
jgi:hypothetical protein